MILGKYNQTPSLLFLSKTLEFVSSTFAIVVFILIPLSFVFISTLFSSLRNFQISRLELDVIEEKRKLTDEICVNNNIGYGMSQKDKLKVLAQAKSDEKGLYIGLLWKNGSAPKAIQKYCIKKQILLSPYKKLAQLNRECEERFLRGEPPVLIEKRYLIAKNKLADELKQKEQNLKKYSVSKPKKSRC